MKKVSIKRIVTSLTILFVFASTSVANANTSVSFQCNGGTYRVEMPAASLYWVNGCVGNLTIDSSVKSIGDRAFEFSRLTSISIPNSVTRIGDSAFQYSDLISVVIPNSVTSMGKKVFASSEIRSIILSNSLTTISEAAFEYAENLISVDIPVGVKTIESEAFFSSGLSTVTIPNTVTTIGDRAFDLTNLAEVDIPDTASLGYKILGDMRFVSIVYCGSKEGLPSQPSCPPARKVIVDAAAKVVADKAAADKAIADAKAAADRAAAAAEAKAKAAAAAEAEAAADRAAIQAVQDAKKLTITCVKGKVKKKITGETPKCPSGYKNPLDSYLTFKAYSNCKLYKKNSYIAGVKLSDGGKTLTFSNVGRYDYSADSGNFLDVECALSVIKTPSFVTAQINSTRALDGLQKATWGKISSFWTYHAENGLNISFNSK